MASYGTMIDVIGSGIPELERALGSNYPDTIASYVTGSEGIAASPAQFNGIAAHCGVFRYDQSPDLERFATGGSDGADVEDHAGTLANAVKGCKARQGRGWWSWVYLSGSMLGEARKAMEDGRVTKVQYGVANWSLSRAQAQGFLNDNPDVSYVQWASPSSNPGTICPGTSRTLAELNVDLNVTRAGWFVKPSNSHPIQTHTGLVVRPDFTTQRVTSTDEMTWKV